MFFFLYVICTFFSSFPLYFYFVRLRCLSPRMLFVCNPRGNRHDRRNSLMSCLLPKSLKEATQNKTKTTRLQSRMQPAKKREEIRSKRRRGRRKGKKRRHSDLLCRRCHSRRKWLREIPIWRKIDSAKCRSAARDYGENATEFVSFIAMKPKLAGVQCVFTQMVPGCCIM